MLFSFGAWMTVSNIVSPIMEYLDRFLVGMLLSLNAVAYYATPFGVVIRLLVLPMAIVGVLFPAFSTALVADHEHAGKLFRRAVKYAVLVLLPLTLLVVLFAQSGLSIWLGPAFATHSTRVLQWLAIGVFANGIAMVPFALIQGAGRADITGKLHLLELPIYVATVWGLTKNYGIEGTAIAWTLRVIIDCVLLFWAVERLLGSLPRLKTILAGIGTIAAVFAMSMMSISLPLKLIVSALELVVYVSVTWFVLFGVEERAFLLKRMRGSALPTQDTVK
jgi:O-antigen/teichoic acid export membrane protein